MEEFNKTELVVSIVLVVFFVIGIIFAVVPGIDTRSGELTMGNFQRILTASCETASAYNLYGSTVSGKYTVRFTPEKKYSVNNVSITYRLYSDGAEFNGVYTAEFDYADNDGPYSITKEGRWTKDSTASSNSILHYIENTVTVTVISISGTYIYRI